MYLRLAAEKVKEGLKYPPISDALSARGSKNADSVENQTFPLFNS
jgi:hypothetical protein